MSKKAALSEKRILEEQHREALAGKLIVQGLTEVLFILQQLPEKCVPYKVNWGPESWILVITLLRVEFSLVFRAYYFLRDIS